jgi:hypothetical protein
MKCSAGVSEVYAQKPIQASFLTATNADFEIVKIFMANNCLLLGTHASMPQCITQSVIKKFLPPRSRPPLQVKVFTPKTRYRPHRNAAVWTGASHSFIVSSLIAVTVSEQPAISSDVTYEPASPRATFKPCALKTLLAAFAMT